LGEDIESNQLTLSHEPTNSLVESEENAKLDIPSAGGWSEISTTGFVSQPWFHAVDASDLPPDIVNVDTWRLYKGKERKVKETKNAPSLELDVWDFNSSTRLFFRISVIDTPAFPLRSYQTETSRQQPAYSSESYVIMYGQSQRDRSGPMEVDQPNPYHSFISVVVCFPRFHSFLLCSFLNIKSVYPGTFYLSRFMQSRRWEWERNTDEWI